MVRKLKRLISIIMVLTMLLSMQLPIFGADNYKNEDKAESLYNMELFLGYSTTKYEPGLGDLSNRAQAIVLIGRALGWNVSKYAGSSFIDVPDYAIGYVEYAVEHDITNGVGNNKFGSLQPVTNMEVYTWYYRALGYQDELNKDAWNNPYALMQAGMITEFQYNDINNEDQLNRDSIVGVMYDSMFWKRANSELSVINELIQLGKVSADKASKEGFADASPIEIEDVTVLTHGKIVIEFNKELDTLSYKNFTMEGAVPKSTALRSDKKTVELSFSSAEPGDTISFTTTNITSYGVPQENVTYEIDIPRAKDLYTTALYFKNGVTQLMSDGVSSAVLIFELMDREGNLVKEDINMVLTFTSYYGDLNATKVALEAGKAQVILTSEDLDYPIDAPVAAQITECDFVDFIGQTIKKEIEMTPNPSPENTPVTEDRIVSASADACDRVRVVMDEVVDVNDYLLEDGTIDPTKATISVRKNAKTSSEGIAVEVQGLMEVPDNPKALDIILNVDKYTVHALRDNDDCWVYFVDSTSDNISISEITFKVEDTTKPYIQSVSTIGEDLIKVVMSESVVNDVLEFRATNADNWIIDGSRLTSHYVFGDVEITTGEFDPETRTDTRNIIYINIEKPLTAKNSHYITGAELGDWAALTDADNFMETQTVNFVVSVNEVDYDQPLATLTVQSPEQWLITYNQDVNESVYDIKDELEVQYYSEAQSEWKPLGSNSAYKATTNMDQDFVISKVNDDAFLIEADIDWSVYWQQYSFGKDYYDYQYRLYLPKEMVSGEESDLTSPVQYLNLNGPILTNDITNPSVVGITASDGLASGSAYDIIFSEPIKLSATANNEGATDSLLQGYEPNEENWDYISEGIVTFIKSDNSITYTGRIDGRFADSFDKMIRVYPLDGSTPTTLENGSWTVTVQGLSDDVGNVMNSASIPISVVGSGSTGVVNAPAIAWAFADVDHDMVVQNVDNTDGDFKYDYIFVKFTKPMKTVGTLESVLSTSNYKIDGDALPSNAQIIPNIEDYDDRDDVVDSITIRLPDNTLDDNTPTLSVSQYIQSIEGIALGAYSINRDLPYDNNTWDVDMASDIQTEYLIMRDKIGAVEVNRNALMSGFSEGEVVAFLATFDLAMTWISTLSDESLVKQSYYDAVNGYLEEIKDHRDYDNHMGAYYFINILSNTYVYMTLETSKVYTNFDIPMPDDEDKDRFTVTITDMDNYGTKVTFDKGTGKISLNHDKDNDNNAKYEQKVTIYDNLFDVKDVFYVIITDDSGNDSFVLAND